MYASVALLIAVEQHDLRLQARLSKHMAEHALVHRFSEIDLISFGLGNSPLPCVDDGAAVDVRSIFGEDSLATHPAGSDADMAKHGARSELGEKIPRRD